LLEELAFGQAGDLYKKLALKEQKVEFLSADFPMNRDRPLFEIFAMVKDERDLEYVRDEVFRTLERFKTQPADPQRLDQLKRRHKYAFLMGLDSPDAVAGALARFVALSGGIEAVDRLFEAFGEVTPDDVLGAARKYFEPRRRSVVVLKGAQP
jgi:zinc protease